MDDLLAELEPAVGADFFFSLVAQVAITDSPTSLDIAIFLYGIYSRLEELKSSSEELGVHHNPNDA